jgi:hypothetical protein
MHPSEGRSEAGEDPAPGLDRYPACMRGLKCTSVALAVSAVLVVVGARSAPKPPSISFTVTPDFVACRDGQLPARVTASWHITHDVSALRLTGAVDSAGNALGPMALPVRRGKLGIVGKRRVFLRCSATTQVLILTGSGKGGTTSVTSSLRENRAD